MRHAMRKQPGIMKLPQTFVINGQEVSNSKYIAEQFNLFVANVGKDKIRNGLLATWRLDSTYNHIYTQQSIVSGLIEAKKNTMGNYSLRAF